jgi:hypothetical protein
MAERSEKAGSLAKMTVMFRKDILEREGAGR